MLWILLAWMLLLDEAAQLNMSRKAGAGTQAETTAEDETQAKAEIETETEETVFKEAETEDGEKSIRVLLMDTGYQSYFHSNAVIRYGDTETEFTPDSPELADEPLIIPGQEDGITVLSIERQDGNPVYQGSLEIRSTESGLLLINELPLETYLESVVPSEMPSSYEPEALKAQAVCARTYACRQIQSGRLKEYGADVDDSVNFQVYGNISPQESTTSAVRETEGQVLCQNGEPVEAFYFSTSSGATSTDEVWGAEEAASYLKAVSCEFDSEEPWSAWTVEIPWDSLEERCREYLSETEQDDADEDGNFLKSLEITRKNQSGVVTGLHVRTGAGSFDLTDEYAIREFLSPGGCTITEKDGSAVQGGALLPSACFTMEAEAGSAVVVYGKGYGHGVGMSQTAANRMAAQGYTCSQILDYFFKDVEITEFSW